MLTLVSIAGLQIRVCNIKLFSYFSTKTYVVGTLKNRLDETVLMSTPKHPKHMFKLMGKKIITSLRLNKGSLTLAMGKCLWFSVKIKVCQSSLSSP